MSNDFNNIIANTAMDAARISDEMKDKEKQRKLDEENNPTNLNLKKVVEQNKEQINLLIEQNELLKQQNENLKQQLDYAIENEKDAKKDAKRNMSWVYISNLIALLSLIATIVIALLD